MNHGYPIFTAEAECQDCFKCVRGCPVKAIKVEDGHASVMPELCLACGHCVEVCPAHAKKIRDDLALTRQILREGGPVYASLAPSWVSEFPAVSPEKMTAALKKLGFAGVSETALGAQAVSQEVADYLKTQTSGITISSACPVAVDFIRKYLPQFTDHISPVLSPALAHAKILHEIYGPNIKVVFIGPCIAKKNEADLHPELISTALLYPTLKQWFRSEQIDLSAIEVGPEDHFVPNASQEGAIYPIEGGMNRTIAPREGCEKINFVTLSGIYAIRQALDGIEPEEITSPVFVETLACMGGCVHGPGTDHLSPGLLERLRIINTTKFPQAIPERVHPEVNENYEKKPVVAGDVSLTQIREALRQVGKERPEDELNCGGCGYDTCQAFAAALVQGKAEPAMCVSYLRQLAQRKSNAMLRCIPAAVVIVDRNLKLIECNRRFAELAGEEAMVIYEAVPGMAGSMLDRLIPFSELFEEVLKTRQEITRDMIHCNGQLLSVNLFNIEPGQVVGAIMFDVTNTEFRREQIAARAKEVIQKNLLTVQEIACKLGEHMAETEILLRSIASDYADQSVATKE